MNPDSAVTPSSPCAAPPHWESPVPWNELTPDCRQRAMRLQTALRPFLEGPRSEMESASDFESRGIRAYWQVFKVLITDRYWRKLHKRTIDRDGGAENWSRLDLYVDDHPKRKLLTLPAPPAGEDGL